MTMMMRLPPPFWPPSCSSPRPRPRTRRRGPNAMRTNNLSRAVRATQSDAPPQRVAAVLRRAVERAYSVFRNQEQRRTRREGTLFTTPTRTEADASIHLQKTERMSAH